jgi:hypothetical protein
MLAGTETHSGQKLTLSKGRTVGCAEPCNLSLQHLILLHRQSYNLRRSSHI